MFTLFLMLVGFWGCIICCNILKQGCATNSQTEGLSTRTASKKSWRTEKNIDILDNSIFYLLLYRLLSLAQSTKLILLLYSTIYVYNKCLLHPNIFLYYVIYILHDSATFFQDKILFLPHLTLSSIQLSSLWIKEFNNNISWRTEPA